jgi:hypothetical protein
MKKEREGKPKISEELSQCCGEAKAKKKKKEKRVKDKGTHFLHWVLLLTGLFLLYYTKIKSVKI